MASKFLHNAVNTPFGVVNSRTGEILVSKKGLTVPATMTGYKRNSRTWMAAQVATRPVLTAAPAVTGTRTVGQTLTVSNGTWTNTPTGYTYSWRRGGLTIPGATAATYVLTAADVGVAVTAVVVAANANGSTVARAPFGNAVTAV